MMRESDFCIVVKVAGDTNVNRKWFTAQIVPDAQSAKDVIAGLRISPQPGPLHQDTMSMITVSIEVN